MEERLKLALAILLSLPLLAEQHAPQMQGDPFTMQSYERAAQAAQEVIQRRKACDAQYEACQQAGGDMVDCVESFKACARTAGVSTY